MNLIDEIFQLTEDNPHITKSGLQFVIRMLHGYISQGAAHLGAYTMEITKKDKKEVIGFDDEDRYIEGNAFGQVYVISGSSATSDLRVMLYTQTSSLPLNEQQAYEVAREAAKESGLTFSYSSYQVKQGTLHAGFGDSHESVSCSVVVGLSTHRIVSFETRGGKRAGLKE